MREIPEKFRENFFELDNFDIFSDFEHFRFNFWKLLFHRKFLVTEERKSWLHNRKFPLRFPYCKNRTTETEKRLRNYGFHGRRVYMRL